MLFNTMQLFAVKFCLFGVVFSQSRMQACPLSATSRIIKSTIVTTNNAMSSFANVLRRAVQHDVR